MTNSDCTTAPLSARIGATGTTRAKTLDIAVTVTADNLMDEKPRFEIVEQIGHGQFSNVYKARWINGPLMPTPYSPLINEAPTITNELQHLHRSPFELNNHFAANQQQQPAQQQVIDNAYNSHFSTSANNKYVALKRIKFYDIQNSKNRMDCVKEVKLLQQLRHPNIINYNISFIERNELFIVLELADGGDLSKLIRYFQKRKQLLTERTILKYFTQVCSAVRYIHSKRILHRDIKPANIFMTSDGCVKLGDFGLGRFFSQDTRDAHSIVGTFYYMSPERIRESGYGFSSDVWSLGCVLYELITLHSPFSVMNLEPLNNNSNRPNTTTNNQPERHLVQQPHRLGAQEPQQQNNNMNNTPPPRQPTHQNPYNLQWLIERIVRAEYPSLVNYNDISVRLRQLTTECLNPNPNARPDMEYICNVVSEAYRPHLTK